MLIDTDDFLTEDVKEYIFFIAQGHPEGNIDLLNESPKEMEYVEKLKKFLANLYDYPTKTVPLEKLLMYTVNREAIMLGMIFHHITGEFILTIHSSVEWDMEQNMNVPFKESSENPQYKLPFLTIPTKYLNAITYAPSRDFERQVTRWHMVIDTDLLPKKEE